MQAVYDDLWPDDGIRDEYFPTDDPAEWENPFYDAGYEYTDPHTTYARSTNRPGINPEAMVWIGVFLVLGILIVGLSSLTKVETPPIDTSVNETTAKTTVTSPTTSTQQNTAPQPAVTAASFIAPYEEYTVTQGPHGASYGHLAIDIAAGRGSIIRSPIDGVISEQYHDSRSGNSVLVLENDHYLITMYHGDFTVGAGQAIRQGDPVGTESNQGYTMDMQGNLCHGRPGCGNHTHLNVFDKKLGENVNPLELLPPANK